MQEVFAVSAKLGIDDLKSFIAHAKANPGKMTCGSAGTGGITHLAIELFKRETGTDLLHVPYRGAAPATNDLLAGTVDTVLLDISVLLPHVRSGAVKVAGRDLRHPPAAAARCADHARAGLPQGQFRQLVRPDLAGRGAARSARKKIFDAASAALKTKELAEAYANVGGVVGGGTSDELKAFLAEERRQVGRRHQGRQHQARVARGPAHRTRPGEDLRRAYPLAGLRRSGPVVMVSHINQQSSAVMVELLQALGAHFRAIAIDYPSHGNSDHIDWQPTIEDYARWR